MSIKMQAEIVSYGRGFLRGKLYSQYFDAPFEFYSLVRMIEKMEELFDTKKFPQAFLTPRTFRDKKDGAKQQKAEESINAADAVDAELYDGPGVASCTFEISVRFRQNATWQGNILWVERNLKQDFRSVLEMIKLVDEALTDEETDVEPVAWE
jgi:hypothetical protein